LFNIIFEVKPNPPDTVDFEFEIYPGIPPWPGASIGENKFIFGDFWFTPNLENGQFIMLPAFTRGDVNGDAFLGVNDALMTFLWIFYVPGAPVLTCLDAADYNDDGAILTDDPLSLLLWIFKVDGSVPPEPPYPECGVDPTPTDFLLCDWHERCMTEATGLPLTSNLRVGAENSLAIGESSMDANGLATLPITLHTARKISGFEVECSFDPHLLTVQSIEKTDLVNSFDFFAPSIDNERGIVRIGGVPDFQMKRLLHPGTYRLVDFVFSRKAQIPEANSALVSLRYVGIYGSRAEALTVEAKDGAIIEGGNRSILPTDFALEQNYPNPFNKRTRIDLVVPYGSDVRLDIFDVCGQRIRTLFQNEQTMVQRLRVFWDGKNDSKEEISSGVYFYRLTCGGRTIVRRMIFLK